MRIHRVLSQGEFRHRGCVQRAPGPGQDPLQSESGRSAAPPVASLLLQPPAAAEQNAPDSQKCDEATLLYGRIINGKRVEESDGSKEGFFVGKKDERRSFCRLSSSQPSSCSYIGSLFLKKMKFVCHAACCALLAFIRSCCSRRSLI